MELRRVEEWSSDVLLKLCKTNNIGCLGRAIILQLNLFELISSWADEVLPV